MHLLHAGGVGGVGREKAEYKGFESFWQLRERVQGNSSEIFKGTDEEDRDDWQCCYW